MPIFMSVRRRVLPCLALIGVFAAMTAAAYAATTHWGTAIGVPGLENSADDQVSSISCTSAGNCAAAGYFRKGNSFVVNEKDGVWGTPIDVPYGTWNSIASISCATAGSCAAGGSYFDGNEHDHAFLVNKRHGVWGKPMKVPGTKHLAGDSSYLDEISCPKPGYCAGVGTYYVNSSAHWQSFLVDERKGVWHKAIKVPGSAALRSSAVVTSISCSGAGSCAAGGSYTNAHGTGKAFVVNENHGVWRKAIEVPGLATLGSSGSVTSLSCSGAGSCAALGSYVDSDGVGQAFVANERHGMWRKAIEVPGLAALNLGGGPSGVKVYSISCATAGSCSATGSYTDGSANLQAFVVSKKNGKWRKAIEVPGLAALNLGSHAEAYSVSCAKAGFCGAGGFYFDASGGKQAFVVSETKGVWKTAIEVPGSAALNTAGDAAVDAVSCGGARACVAGGFYVGDLHATQSFVTAP